MLTAINFILLWIVVLINLVITLAMIRKINQNDKQSLVTHSGLENNTPLPDLALQTIDENPQALHSLVGTKMMISVISSSCKPCLDFIEKLPTVKQNLLKHQIDLSVIHIGNDVSPAVTQSTTDADVMLLVDPTNAILQQFTIPGTPFFFQIDEGGVITDQGYDIVWKIAR